MSQKPTTSLGSVIKINPASISKHYPYDDIEYVDISSVSTGYFGGSTLMPLAEAPSRAKRLVKHGDTILSTVRPNLRSFLFIKNPPENMVVSTGFAVLHPSKEIDARFLYYTVTDQKFTDYLTANAKGSAYPAVDTETIARAEISLPTLETQRKIAAILFAYDDLIENNTRRIKILEEMAQAIYREWFINFRFPGHEKVKMVDSPKGKVPEGWETKTIGDVCTIIPGYAFKSNDWQTSGIPVIKIKNINSDNTINIDEADFVSEQHLRPTMEKFLLKDGDILIAMTGATAGKIGKLRSGKPMLLNQRVAKIAPHDPFNAFIWCTICTKECQALFFRLADGAAQPNMSGHQIEGFPILLPTMKLCQDFSETAGPLLLEIDILIHCNKNLRQTRDLLLPKLISGELDVSDLDIKTDGIGNG